MARDLFYDRNKQLFNALAASSEQTFFFESDMKNNTSLWSPNAVDYFDLPNNGYLCPADKLWAEKIHPDDLPVFLEDFQRMATHVSHLHNCEYRIKNKYGVYIRVNCKGSVTYDKDGNMEYFAGFVVNLGNRTKVDPVSELRSIFEFRNTLFNIMDCVQSGFVYSIEVQNFKEINDDYGYSFGDQVIYALGKKMQSLLPISSAIYRLEGSTFATILPDTSKETLEEYDKLVREHLSSLQVEKMVGRYVSIHLKIWSSATSFPQDGDTIEKIHNNVFYALEQARSESAQSIVYYNQDFFKKRERLAKIKRLLKRSVENDFDGFQIYTQPILDSQNGKCKAVEILLRYKTREFGMLAPTEFIPLLEKSKDIIPVGQWVIEQSLTQLKSWKEKYGNNSIEKIHVNVSSLQLENGSFLNEIAQQLQKLNLSTQNIVLELKEVGVVENLKTLSQNISALRNAGFHFALDDFGGANSSWAMLHDFPADILKLDYSREHGFARDEKNKHILNAISSYCKTESVSLYAEGIEDEKTLEFINDVGYDNVQGYLYSKPLPLHEFEEKFLKKS